MRLKRGDKVKCIRAQELHGLFFHQIYTVQNPMVEHNTEILITVKELPSHFYKNRFILIKTKKHRINLP
jgi:hypothetical protein